MAARLLATTSRYADLCCLYEKRLIFNPVYYTLHSRLDNNAGMNGILSAVQSSLYVRSIRYYCIHANSKKFDPNKSTHKIKQCGYYGTTPNVDPSSTGKVPEDINHEKFTTKNSEDSDVDAQTLDAWFTSIDENRDGLISKREFRTWYWLHFVPTFKAKGSGESTKELDETEHTNNITKGSSQQNLEYLRFLEKEAVRVRSCLGLNSAPTCMPNMKPEAIASGLFLLVAIRSSIPYIGFGFIDNCVMLLCGEIIDVQLGALLGLSTLAAAGLGNLFSCATGVVTGGFIERAVCNFAWLPKATLSPGQAESPRAKNAHLIGSVTGICIGCLIGMFPLLFLPPRHRKADTSIQS